MSREMNEMLQGRLDKAAKDIRAVSDELSGAKEEIMNLTRSWIGLSNWHSQDLQGANDTIRNVTLESRLDTDTETGPQRSAGHTVQQLHICKANGLSVSPPSQVSTNQNTTCIHLRQSEHSM